MNENICAISTALGVGAISIVRASGPEVIEITNKIFKGKDLTKVDSHTINYGHIVDHDEVIDEVLVSIMKAPKTFTMEDVVEINSHGGISTTNKILELLLENGCRLADPGEFTKKAFLNGRIDLVEAEGINDLIVSQTDSQRKFAMNRLNGNLSRLIKDMRKDIMELEGKLEVAFDYPDEIEDEEELTYNELKDTMLAIKSKLTKLVNSYKNASIIKDGINVSIVGKPNVGKSSILNHLLDEDKAIVTDIAGTTRDIVEGTLMIDGVKIDILDTAGIRETNDIVESIGVEKSVDAIKEADLVLFVIDSNDGFTKEDEDILNKLNNKEVLVIYNKSDLKDNYSIDKLNNYNSLNISTFDKEKIEKLKNKISEIFDLKSISESNYTYITNARQISLLNKCINIINEINKEVENKEEVDLIEIDIKRLWETLSEITGEVNSDDLLNEIFSKFCLGK